MKPIFLPMFAYLFILMAAVYLFDCFQNSTKLYKVSFNWDIRLNFY